MPERSLLTRALEFFTRLHATPELDVTANLEHLDSGEPTRVRSGLRYLAMIGPPARRARSRVAALVDDPDPEVSALARAALDAIDGRAR
ncbi:MAG: hypothetical protein H6713_13035 [Myxococcales bacterium]|nr:hypothetical protein [Myxococcales bacterium]MCB9750905.1 hypothetical protein [Myxococcales bacterium]